MTDVAITWDRPDRGGQSGTVRFTPTARYFRDDTRVTDAPVAVTVLPGQTAIVSLDPTGLTWCYHVEWIPDGTDAPPWSEWVTVEPDPARPLDRIPYHRLPQLTRDAAALLTGERARTAAALLTDVQAEGGQLRELAQQTTAEAAAALDGASSAATSARAAAELSQASALSVLPMVAGSVAAAVETGTVPVDLGLAVNTVAAGSEPVDVTFPPVTTPNGETDPDGLGTLLHVTSGADSLTWPGGTVVHGRPPVDAEAFATVVRVAGAVHVVWSAVDSTPPPLAGGGVGAAQAALTDVLSAGLSVAPGGTVVTDGTDGGGWQFTNLTGAVGTDLTLTAGVVTSVVQSTGDAVRVDKTITFTPGGTTYVHVNVSPLNPPMTMPPEGVGVILATRPAPGVGDPTPERDDAWADLTAALIMVAFTVRETPGDWTSDEWLVARMTPGDPAWLAVSEWGGAYEHAETPVRPSPTLARDVWQRTADDFTALGIALPARVVPMSEIDARVGGNSRE